MITTALKRAQLPSDSAFLQRYAHQLSGGQQQRVLIALAIVTEPWVVVLDEPTTGLDVITQAGLLREVRTLCDRHGLSFVYVSHDIAAVSAVADQIAIIYAGRLVELGPTSTVLREPAHPYTQGLIRSVPDHRERLRLEGIGGIAVTPGEWPRGCAFAPRCRLADEPCRAELPILEPVSGEHTVRCICWREAGIPPRERKQPQDAPDERGALLRVSDLRATHKSRHEEVVAADGIGFELAKGECLALVGESGSGKTTIARSLIGLHPPVAGSIFFDGELLRGSARERSRETRRRIQFIFQNPYESLNPRHTVETQLVWAASSLLGIDRSDARSRAVEALETVRLPKRTICRYPSELSGGERQRVALARALVVAPDVLICDEITSALDVSVQAAVLEVLDDLRRNLHLAMLFITHDLGVVASIADRVIVLHKGKITDCGPTFSVLTGSQNEYTKALVGAAPVLEGSR